VSEVAARVEHEETEHEVAPPLGQGELLAPGYAVVAHLNRGRALDVYDVWSEERACRCVAKVLRPDRIEDRRVRGSLLREGRILKRLTHPHIVRAYETLEEPQPVVILETLTGYTLEYLIFVRHRRRRFPLSDITFLGLHLCSAMHYLHRQGLLHLDLKPSNIVSNLGIAKVIDLSIARRPGRARRRGIGTRQYMAPEQARGGLLSEATDVWGIGAVLFHAATGRRPFEAETGRKYQQLERRADPVRAHRRVPATFGTAVDRCLDPEPSRRPTVGELAELLNGLAHEQSWL
jgi:serine/threonine protein kinase